MTARSFVWLAIGGGAWGLASNWADETDGISPSLSVPGAQDSITVASPSGAALQTITGPGQAAAALFTGNTLLSGTFAITDLVLGQAASGGLLELAAGTALQSATASVVSGSLLVDAGATFSAAGTLTLGGQGGADAALSVTSGGTAAVAALFLASGTDSIYVDPTSILDVGGTQQGHAGQLTIDAGGLLAGEGNADAYGAIANDGTITAQGGTLAVGTLSGTGSLVIGAGATLLLDGACQAGQSVTFMGANATLALAAEFDAPSGTLTGLAAGDAIDVTGSLISQATYQATGAQAGLLTLFYGTQVADTVHLAGSYAGCVFLTTGDGDGGTLVTLAAAAGSGGPPSPGTANPDQYAWNGNPAGKWSNAANWTDATLGQTPARIAPGANDLVTIAAAASAFTVISGPADAAALGITGEVALSGAYQLGTLTVGTAGATAGTGTLDLLAGASAAAASASIADGAISVAGSNSALTVAGTLTLGGGPSGVGLPTATLSATAGGLVQAAGLVLGGGSGASIVTDTSASVEVGTAGGAQPGAVTIDPGATLSGNGSVNPLGAVTDDGTILATGGTLSLGAVSGTGSLAVAPGATLELLAASADPIALQGSVAAGGSVLAFSNARAAPTGTLTGLAPGDALHLEGSQLTSVQFVGNGTGGTLVLSYGTTVVDRLLLAGSFANVRFVLATDGGTGTLITLAAATGGGGGPGQTGTDQLAWATPGSGAWGRAVSWNDETTGRQATSPPNAQTPVSIAGPGGTSFQDISGQGTCASLSLTGNTILSGGTTTGALAVAQGSALVAGAATTLSAAQAVTNGALLASGAGAVLAVAGTLSLAGPGSLLEAEAHGAVQCGSLVLAGGTASVDEASSLEVGTLGAPAAGLVTIDAGAQASGAGSLAPAGTLADNGSVTAQGGTLWLGDATGTGALAIGAGAVLALSGTDTCPIAFVAGGATLLLAGGTVAGTITGFAAGDAIIIANTAPDSVSYALGSAGLGTLTLGEDGQSVGQLVLAGGYAGQVFSIQPDGAGAEVTVAAPAATGPGPGTATPDAYVWVGGQGDAWANAANWQDVTAGQSPAAIAPGLHNAVSIAGGNGATLQVSGPADAASLSLTGTVGLAGAFSLGTLTVAPGQGAQPGLLSLATGSSLAAGQASVAGGLALSGGALAVATTLTLGAPTGAAGVLDATGAAVALAGALLLDGSGSAVMVGAAATVEVGGGSGGSAGNFTVDAGGMATGAGSLAAAGTIADQGTITASGGTLVLGSVSGGGLLEMGVGAELVLAGSVAVGLTADFAGAGTLSLGAAALAGAPAIAGFGTGDAILLAAAGATAATYAQTAPGQGFVSILSGSQTIAELTLLGDQAGRVFSVAGSAGGGTILTTTPDNTTGGGGGFVSNPTTSYGETTDANSLDNMLGGLFSGEALTDLTNLIDGQGGINQSAYLWYSADGLTPGAASQQETSVEVVGPLSAQTGAGNGPGLAIAMQAGYSAVLLEGQENAGLTDGGLGGALLAGNAGNDTIAALGDNDTLVGAAGASTTFYAALKPGAASSTTGYDVVIHGGGNDLIATNNDTAAITTSGGHSEVFLGDAQNQVYTNHVTLDGADTVICGSGSGFTQDNVTVNAAAGLAGNLAFGAAVGLLNFVGGATASTVVGTGGELLVQGGSANGNIVWAGNGDLSYVGGTGATAIVTGSGQANIQGGAAPITVFGGSGSLYVHGAAAGSALVVGDGASTVVAGAGVDVYVTGGANVSVAGGAGADVYGGTSTGNNVFQATAGNETLWGGLGNDLFLAGTGQDLLVGGGGNDTFSFTNGACGGSDTICGFVPGESTLALHGYGPTAPQITYAYGDSILNLQDGTQIVVYDVAHLTASSITMS